MAEKTLSPEQKQELIEKLKASAKSMSTLANEDRELSLDELDAVSGGTNVDDELNRFFEGCQGFMDFCAYLSQIVKTGICPECKAQIGVPPVPVEKVAEHLITHQK